MLAGRWGCGTHPVQSVAEASIGAFYRRFAQATIDTPETREQLFEYFVDKMFIGSEQIIIASYFYDSPQSHRV